MKQASILKKGLPNNKNNEFFDKTIDETSCVSVQTMP
jgi:hypothetical protein